MNLNVIDSEPRLNISILFKNSWYCTESLNMVNKISPMMAAVESALHLHANLAAAIGRLMFSDIQDSTSELCKYTKSIQSHPIQNALNSH